MSPGHSDPPTPFFDFTPPLPNIGPLDDGHLLLSLSPPKPSAIDFDVNAFILEDIDMWSCSQNSSSHDPSMYAYNSLGLQSQTGSPESTTSTGTSTVGLSPFAHKPSLMEPQPMRPYLAENSSNSAPHHQQVSSRPASTRPFDGISASFAFSSVRSTATTPQGGSYYLDVPGSSMALPPHRRGVSLDGVGPGGRVPAVAESRSASAASRRTPPYISRQRAPSQVMPRISKAHRDVPHHREVVATPAVALASQSRRKRQAIFKCSICPSEFTKKINLEGHERSHRGDKPFKCVYHPCEKGFARESDLKRHMKIHERNAAEAGGLTYVA
ncbi:hypothetical protein PUNSTDRAFT_44165 [Punctularia strigosozonata HHB-11173 SS5]|uniref:uncharacterized protein n=1 Tax=Punctularia strigosozonata (strain HHB-11173) TaxID=741275 RepID=UPI000441706C|nr:uncharacterized protein PUNSTDRAFT_44165 [Punctularia strigosozonata HHB-11173 SS5]EIN09951.1 hypothetical protein PUNSTDRAFT_44165 [Punctularia strigosozonata HHB-11173 SS5]